MSSNSVEPAFAPCLSAVYVNLYVSEDGEEIVENSVVIKANTGQELEHLTLEWLSTFDAASAGRRHVKRFDHSVIDRLESVVDQWQSAQDGWDVECYSLAVSHR